MLGNIPSHMCAQQGLKPACVSAHSDQDLRGPHKKTASLAMKNAPNEDSDQFALTSYMCAQRRRKQACSSAHSDQNLRGLHDETVSLA